MDKKRKICTVLVDRANYGRLKPVLSEIKNDSTLNQHLICAGTMVLERFGKVSDIVRKDGFKVDSELYFEIEGSIPATIAIIEGKIKIGDKNHDKVNSSTLIILAKGEKLKVKGVTKSKFLLISGKPIGEPIARGGPFVMNTKQEILQAVEDYNNGNFVQK